jgi:CO dehydrogenase/acetyl-CoA synthase beta subunit
MHNMQAHRYKHSEIESVLERIRHKLIQQKNMNDTEGYMDLEEQDQVLILKFSTKKTPSEKQAILEELAGSGLQFGNDYIEDSIRIAFREDEEDRDG